MFRSTVYVIPLLNKNKLLDQSRFSLFHGGLRLRTHRCPRSTLGVSDSSGLSPAGVAPNLGLASACRSASPLCVTPVSPAFSSSLLPWSYNPSPLSCLSALERALGGRQSAVPPEALSSAEDCEGESQKRETRTGPVAVSHHSKWKGVRNVASQKRRRKWKEHDESPAEFLAALSGFPVSSPMPSSRLQTRLSSLASTSLSSLRGISKIRLKTLEDLANLRSCFDLLLFLPLQYVELQTRTAVPHDSEKFSEQKGEFGTTVADSGKVLAEGRNDRASEEDKPLANATRKEQQVGLPPNVVRAAYYRSDSSNTGEVEDDKSEANLSGWTLQSGERLHETPDVDALSRLGLSFDGDVPRTASSQDAGGDAYLNQVISREAAQPLLPPRCFNRGQGAVAPREAPAVSKPSPSFPGWDSTREDRKETGGQKAGRGTSAGKEPDVNVTESEKEKTATSTRSLEEQQRELRQKLEKSLSRYLALQEEDAETCSGPGRRGRRRKRNEGADGEETREEEALSVRDVALIGCVEKISHCKLRTVKRGKPLMISTAVARDVFFSPSLRAQKEDEGEGVPAGRRNKGEKTTQEARNSAGQSVSGGTGDTGTAKSDRRTANDRLQERSTGGKRRRQDEEGRIYVTWFDKFFQLVKLKKRHVVCLVGKAVRTKTGRLQMKNPTVHFLAPSEETFFFHAVKEFLPDVSSAPCVLGDEENGSQRGKEGVHQRSGTVPNKHEAASAFQSCTRIAWPDQQSVPSAVASFSSAASPSSSPPSSPENYLPSLPSCFSDTKDEQPSLSLHAFRSPCGTPGAPEMVRFPPPEEASVEIREGPRNDACATRAGAGFTSQDKTALPAGPDIRTQTNSEHVHVHKLMPIYPSISGVPAKILRAGIETLLRENSFAEVVPEFLRKKRGIERLDTTLRALHHPQTLEDVRKARRDLFYSTMLWLQLAKKLRTREVESQFRGYASRTGEEILQAFYASLNFSLTPSQLQAIEEIRADMESPRPMRRLLQGDVGSGKTAVAAVALLLSASAGHQAALLAPTAALARQHQINLQKFLGPLGFHVHLLVSDIPDKDATIRLINTGNAEITVGTHALLQDYVLFPRLGLVVIDEQHKFGVNQRWKLLLKRHRHEEIIGGSSSKFCEPEQAEAAVATDAGREKGKRYRHKETDGESISNGHPEEETTQGRENDSTVQEHMRKGTSKRYQRTPDAVWTAVHGRGTGSHEKTVELDKGGERQHQGIDFPGGEEGGRMADVLLMTATPIPRTQVLLKYGDLKLSKILASEIRHSRGMGRWAGEQEGTDERATAAFRGKPWRGVGEQGRPKGSGVEPRQRGVATYLIDKGSQGEMAEMMKIIKKEISKKRQVFWVCPLVDGVRDASRRRGKSSRRKKGISGRLGSVETGDRQPAGNEVQMDTRNEEGAKSEKGGPEEEDTKDKGGEIWNKLEATQGQNDSKESAAVQRFEELRKLLPEIRIRLLHGRMKAEEKNEVLSELRGGTVDLLVATTVVEVGIDVPNASVIVIDSAERFGLTQLHQLRGRVGRDARHPSFCFIILDPLKKNLDEKAMHRFAAIAATTDGFQLAETDARLRGGGTLFGRQQHGQSDLWMIHGLKRSEQTRLLEAATEDSDHIVELLDGDEANSRYEVGLVAESEHLFSAGERGGQRNHIRTMYDTPKSLEAQRVDENSSSVSRFRDEHGRHEDTAAAQVGVEPRESDDMDAFSNPNCISDPCVKDANKNDHLPACTPANCENDKGNASDSSFSEHSTASHKNWEGGVSLRNGYPDASEDQEWGHTFNQNGAGKDAGGNFPEVRVRKESTIGQEKSFSAEEIIREARQLVEEVRLLIPPKKIDWLFRV
ncbi:DEAD/DEAH box helicase domain-containing protein [Toxoplasma gondii ME49]|uniref:DEAD/DEAH box helicase domain-containing protein n=1 Tax=Toxoplasma gondii (strain ATCC 50611 / Me49) TaxID=508771 RepID=S8GUT9_TOXGM|nr:DEAD/DEAH box helicase domain-containing protein [Toxoplasma gondii ME49]EPT32364.1 DEAD/DEAH box helicase domain-containing protein [Toxoplasma gondii ME49]|eukprot:XP_018638470.1 DEAD/DEAH box helicase domain-containing protein [Toxoplasma gondii ME49]